MPPRKQASVAKKRQRGTEIKRFIKSQSGAIHRFLKPLHPDQQDGDDVEEQNEDMEVELDYFLYIVDQASASLETRFQQFKEYEKLFGFLFPHMLMGIEDEELKLSCQLLEDALKFEDRSDLNGNELYMELKLFNTSNTGQFNNPIDVLKHLREFSYFPNACVAYRILLTIPVTVASAERSFSKLKLLKSYLRSIMSQERLSGLAIIAIENEIFDNINCEDVINQFAMKNARRASRVIG